RYLAQSHRPDHHRRQVYAGEICLWPEGVVGIGGQDASVQRQRQRRGFLLCGLRGDQLIAAGQDRLVVLVQLPPLRDIVERFSRRQGERLFHGQEGPPQRPLRHVDSVRVSDHKVEELRVGKFKLDINGSAVADGQLN